MIGIEFYSWCTYQLPGVISRCPQVHTIISITMLLVLQKYWVKNKVYARERYHYKICAHACIVITKSDIEHVEGWNL